MLPKPPPTYAAAIKAEALHFTLTVVFEPAAEGGFTCHFAELPEAFSEGETIERAGANLHDAFQLVLAHHRDEAAADMAGVVRQTYACRGAAA